MDLFDLNPELIRYIEDHTSPEDKILLELRRFTFLKVVHPRMISGPVQGKFLEMISKIMHPAKILEIGTYTGYSAICLAKGLTENGKLYTIEINDELVPVQDTFFRKAGIQDKVIRITGDALVEIPKLNETFDLIFIDGDKEQYSDYYRYCYPILKKGGLMIADNVLWNGKVIIDQCKEDRVTKAILEFNSLITNDKNSENILLPLRDGLMLIRKL